MRIAHVSPSGTTAVEKALTGCSAAPPVLLAWSPTGSSLIVGYKTGDLRIWKRPPHTEEDPLPWAQVLRVKAAFTQFCAVPAHPSQSVRRRTMLTIEAIFLLTCCPW